MRAKPDKRLLAERLRREEGLSYNEIAGMIGVSKSTLSSWLKSIHLSPEQEERLETRLRENRASFAARALPINRERYRKARQQAHQAGVAVVNRLPDTPDLDELAFAILYLGEGTKTGNSVQLASTDAAILQFFVWGLKRIYYVPSAKLHYRVNLIEAARAQEHDMIHWWAGALGCEANQFGVTQYDPRSRSQTVSSEYHGVCTVSFYDTYLRERF